MRNKRHGFLITFVSISLLLGAGCARIEVHRNALMAASEEVKPTEKIESGSIPTRKIRFTHHTVFFGLISLSRPLLIENHCGRQNWEQIVTRSNLWQSLVRGLTLGLYIPWEVELTCAENAASQQD